MGSRMNVIFFFVFVLSSNAFAIVNTQLGQDLFICNAGLRHPTVNPEFKGGNNTLQFSYEDFSVPENSEARWRSQRIQVSQGQTQFAAISATDADAFSNNIMSPRFSLSTESQGAEYFVDVCYRGPTLPGNNLEARGQYQLSFQVARLASSVVGAQADVRAQVSIKCDLQGSGLQRNQRRTGENAPSAFEVDSQWSSGAFSLREDDVVSSFVDLNSQFSEIPRFCVFRVLVAEPSLGIRPQGFKGFDLDVYFSVEK
jgi:hypothetical protein